MVELELPSTFTAVDCAYVQDLRHLVFGMMSVNVARDTEATERAEQRSYPTSGAWKTDEYTYCDLTTFLLSRCLKSELVRFTTVVTADDVNAKLDRDTHRLGVGLNHRCSRLYCYKQRCQRTSAIGVRWYSPYYDFATAAESHTWQLRDTQVVETRTGQDSMMDRRGTARKGRKTSH